LEPLIKLAASNDPQGQLRAVTALRGLSVDEQLRMEIVQRGGLTPLLNLSQTEDVEIQMEVLATLCNLSLCGCIGDNPLSFIKSVDISSLASFLCSADVTYRLFGAVALGNIASEKKLQGEMMETGVLDPLITVANAGDLETQRCIAYALCNLASDPKHRASIVEQGGLPPLISLACSEDPHDMRAGLATLRGLAATPDHRRPILLAGALEAMSLGARCEEDVEVRREAAAGLSVLALNEANKIDIAKNQNAMADLVALAQRPDATTARDASSALANLSENEGTHEALLGGWGSAFLAELIHQSPDTGLKREVVRCLANLAGNYATHDHLLEGECHQALVTAIELQDAHTARFASIAFMNLAAQPQNHQALIGADAHIPLVGLANGDERDLVFLNARGERKKQEVDSDEEEEKKLGFAPTQLDFEEEDERERLDKENMLELGYDLECRRYACLALGQMAASSDIHPQLLEAGALESLRESLDVEDMETRFNAAFALNKLAINSENHQVMGEGGVIPPLVQLAGEAEGDPRCQAISCLRRLALLNANSLEEVDEGILDPLSWAAEGGDAETQREVAACICNLSVSDENRVPIVGSASLVVAVAATMPEQGRGSGKISVCSGGQRGGGFSYSPPFDRGGQCHAPPVLPHALQAPLLTQRSFTCCE